MDAIRYLYISNIFQNVSNLIRPKKVAKRYSIYRRLTLGLTRKLQADDWLMLCVVVPYTSSIILANQVGSAQSPTQRKLRYVLEETQILTMWLVKACLLVLYWRILYVHHSS